jgi:hypothetical protein
MLSAGLVLLIPAAPPSAAHEVPANVAVQAYVKPEGRRLTLLVRVPLVSIRDIEFPLTGPGYLDLNRVDARLRDAARIWIAGYVAFFENGAPLPEEEIVAARVSLPSDRSFTSYETALAHVTGEPPSST